MYTVLTNGDGGNDGIYLDGRQVVWMRVLTAAEKDCLLSGRYSQRYLADLAWHYR
jgi:hypothetical protein